ADQRLYMSVDAAAIGVDRRRLYALTAALEDPAGFSLLQVPVADFRDGDAGLPGLLAFAKRIAAGSRRAEDLAGSSPCLVAGSSSVRPAMAPPPGTLRPASGAVAHDKHLPAGGVDPHAKARQFGVPSDGPSVARLKRVDRPLGQLRTPQFACRRLGHHLVITEFESPVESETTPYNENLWKFSD